MRPLAWKAVTWSLGTFGAITFTLCVVYGLLVPKTLHMVQFLEVVLPRLPVAHLRDVRPGSSRASSTGPTAGLVFTPLYNYFSRREAPDAR